jgi:hypothetical protein
MNNLDLTVTNARSKETYLGNSALYNNTADRANTLEQVTIAALGARAGPHAARQRARHRLHTRRPTRRLRSLSPAASRR